MVKLLKYDLVVDINTYNPFLVLEAFNVTFSYLFSKQNDLAEKIGMKTTNFMDSNYTFELEYIEFIGGIDYREDKSIKFHENKKFRENQKYSIYLNIKDQNIDFVVKELLGVYKNNFSNKKIQDLTGFKFI